MRDTVEEMVELGNHHIEGSPGFNTQRLIGHLWLIAGQLCYRLEDLALQGSVGFKAAEDAADAAAIEATVDEPKLPFDPPLDTSTPTE